MSTRYPCPNPTCIHEFEAAQLSGASSLTCPVCGMVLQLRVTPNPPAAVPMAQPVQAVPMASPVTAVPQPPPPRPLATSEITVPMAIPVSTAVTAAPPPLQPLPAAPLPFDDRAPIVRGTRAPRRRDWLTYTAVIGGFGLAVAFGVGAYLVGFRGGSVGDTTFTAARSTDYNVQFQSPGKPWLVHDGIKAALPAALLAMHRENPSAWMAIDARKFDHQPGGRELDAEARRKLGKYLRNLETDPPVGSPIKEGETVSRQSSFRFVFVGDMFVRENSDGEKVYERVTGECVMFGFQGIGYWIYTWMPVETTKNEIQKKQILDQFAELRSRFSLLGDREEWKQLQQRRTVFIGKSANYQLVDRTGRWQEFANEDPKDHDEKADLVLFAPSPTARNIIERRQTAKTLLVLVLPPSTDGDAARKYFLDKVRKESETAVIEAADDGAAASAMPNEPGGRVHKWRVAVSPSRVLFAVAGVATREKETVVAYAECDWNERTTYEALFEGIASSLQKRGE